jgi:hypothetical protein
LKIRIDRADNDDNQGADVGDCIFEITGVHEILLNGFVIKIPS